MKRIVSIVSAFAFGGMLGFAQVQFNHLDFSLTAGTTGIGFDLAMPVASNVPVIGDVQVRAGAAFMPHFNKKMNFGVEVGDVSYDAYTKYCESNNMVAASNNSQEYLNWASSLSSSRFSRLSSLLESFTGMAVDNSIDMIGEPNFNNFKFMVDVFPFKNKHWHFTAGFYLGGTNVAKAYNTTEDMNSLVAVSIYNNMYKRAVAEDPLIEYNGNAVFLPSEFTDRLRDYGQMGIRIGDFSHDVYATEDIYWDYSEYDPITGDAIHEKGDLRYAKGDVVYKKGDPYYLMPDKDNMVKAYAKVNKFRPYVGFGYGGPISADKRTSISFDAGVMCWGGSPSIITHDGIDMVNDLENVRGKPGDYIDLIKQVKVYPVLNLRITQRLF